MSSVLDSDIRSIGPILRILCTAIGGSPLSANGTGARSNMPLSLIEKPHMLGESNPKFSKTLMENGDNSRSGISFAHVPSQSSEMAEKILQLTHPHPLLVASVPATPQKSPAVTSND